MQRTLNGGNGWRVTTFEVAVCWGVFIWGTTELLSFIHQVNLPGVIIVWLAAISVLAGATLRRRSAVLAESAQLACTVRNTLSLRGLGLMIALATAGIVAVLACIAIAAAPNNWDSMTYHLARVMHWQQNQTVAFYPTHIQRQLYTRPWAEYAILHFQILSGGDRLANLVHFSAFVLSAIGVSVVTQLLGGSYKAQGLAAVMAVTLPMGVLQATSTQNDFVVGLWLVSFVCFGLQVMKQPKTATALFSGASLGLGILTKSTIYVFALPFVCWIGLSLFERYRRLALKPLILITVATLGINTGHCFQHFMLYGSPSGPIGEEAEMLQAVEAEKGELMEARPSYWPSNWEKRTLSLFAAYDGHRASFGPDVTSATATRNSWPFWNA